MNKSSTSKPDQAQQGYRPRFPILWSSLLVSACLLASGCGQKGGLTRPEAADTSSFQQ